MGHPLDSLVLTTLSQDPIHGSPLLTLLNQKNSANSGANTGSILHIPYSIILFRYYNAPNNVTCKIQCAHEYRYKATVGYSDLAEEARLECEDGCDIALLLAEAGYYAVNGSMLECPAGTYRQSVNVTAIVGPFPFISPEIALNVSTTLRSVTHCEDCPYGTYRSSPKGTSLSSCSKCPIGKYANQTGTTIDVLQKALTDHYL